MSRPGTACKRDVSARCACGPGPRGTEGPTVFAIGRDAAAAKLRALGEGARIAALPREELAASLDPRALDLRSAALGRWSPDPRMARPSGGVDSEPDRRRTGRRNEATSEGR